MRAEGLTPPDEQLFVPSPVHVGRRDVLLSGAALLGGALLACGVIGCGNAPVSAFNGTTQTPAGHNNANRLTTPELDISPDHPWTVDFSTMRDGPVPEQLFGFDIGTGPNGDGWGNGEEEYYTNSQTNARIENKALVIRARRQRFGGANYTSARLNTQGRFDFAYGRLELDMKMPAGAGTWGAVWLWPSGKKYSPQDAGVTSEQADEYELNGELDIAELWGRWPGSVQTSVHTYEQLKNNQNGGDKNVQVPDAATGYHRFGIIKEKDFVAFTYNGNTYFEQRRPAGSNPKNWPFDQLYHLIVNLAIGDGDGPIDEKTAQQWEISIRRITYTPLDMQGS